MAPSPSASPSPSPIYVRYCVRTYLLYTYSTAYRKCALPDAHCILAYARISVKDCNGVQCLKSGGVVICASSSSSRSGVHNASSTFWGSCLEPSTMYWGRSKSSGDCAILLTRSSGIERRSLRDESIVAKCICSAAWFLTCRSRMFMGQGPVSHIMPKQL